MALFTSLNTALTGLNAAMAALQTTGHNIANASTPGFSRQRIDLDTNPAQDMGRFVIGRGVDISRVSRVIDLNLESRLRDSASTLGNLSVQSDALQQLEALTNALSDAGLGQSLDHFFAALQDLANDPADQSTRSAVIQAAQTTAQAFNYVGNQVRLSRTQLNDDVVVTVGEINRIAGEIADLNRQVLLQEHGGVDLGAANDLRDRRGLLARELSERIGITALETSTGELNILVGSAFLVFGQQSFGLTTTQAAVDGVLIDTPVFSNGSAALTVTNGKLRGLLDARDSAAREFEQGIDILANQFIYQFNRVQSTGQGLERFASVLSGNAVPNASVAVAREGTMTAVSTLGSLTDSSLVGVASPVGRRVLILSGANQLERRTITGFDGVSGTIFFDTPLPRAMAVGDRYQITELDFPVVNGSFKLVVTNETTGLQQSFTITVDLDKVGADSTLTSIAAQLNAALPGSTTVLGDGRLQIQSGASNVRLSFADDTSGFLAAMGLNRFFNGSDATTMALNPALANNSALLSAATTNSPGDNSNALAFVGLRSAALVNGTTFEDFYQSLAGVLGNDAAEVKDRLKNQQLLDEQLTNQRERVSGVNVDEEAVKMLEYQRSFQASARFISVVDQLLETLITGL